MSSALLIQHGDGEYARMLELTGARHAAYCERHSIAFWTMRGSTPGLPSPHWNKIALLIRGLEMNFEVLAWLDADTLIVRDETDIRCALAGGAPIGLAQHPGGAGADTHWNTGVMIVKNTPRVREFLDAVLKSGPLGNHVWQEQARILDVLPRFPDLVQRLDDRWNSTATVNEVPEPIVKAWHGFGKNACVEIYEELRALNAIGGRVVEAARHLVHSDNCVERAADFIARIPPYPGRFDGRGIVICGGGPAYFTNAWVAIHQLRRVGCALPIEVWYLGPKEMDSRMRALLKPLGVNCMDAHEVCRQFPARILNGWELKAYALLHSSFREVLLLDADNVALVDPEFLFDTPPYRERGAIFWPDFTHMEPHRSAWRVFDVPYCDEPEFESGQIVLNKERCWRPLKLAMWYNEFSDFFYKHVYGDKDTFRFAWHRLQQPFAMPPFPIHALEDTMCQHDFAGSRIFQHRNCDKWSYRRQNKRIAGFQFEEECLADVARLRILWDGTVRGETSPSA